MLMLQLMMMMMVISSQRVDEKMMIRCIEIIIIPSCCSREELSRRLLFAWPAAESRIANVAGSSQTQQLMRDLAKGMPLASELSAGFQLNLTNFRSNNNSERTKHDRLVLQPYEVRRQQVP